MKSLLRFFGHAVRDTSTIADLGGVGYEVAIHNPRNIMMVMGEEGGGLILLNNWIVGLLIKCLQFSGIYKLLKAILMGGGGGGPGPGIYPLPQHPLIVKIIQHLRSRHKRYGGRRMY